MIFLHQLSAVLTGQKKQALAVVLSACLHDAEQIYASFGDRGTIAPTEEKVEVPLTLFGPKF